MYIYNVVKLNFKHINIDEVSIMNQDELRKV